MTAFQSLLVFWTFWFFCVVHRSDADVDCPKCFRKDHFLYYYIDEKTSYIQARQICHAHAGRLVGIDTSDLQDTIVTFLNDADIKTTALIGINDIIEDGVWVTEDQEINPYEDGWKKKPENSNGKDCVIMEQNKKRRWMETVCSQSQPYVCEVLNIAEEDCPSVCFHRDDWIAHITFDKTTWLTSRKVCIDRGGDLYSMNNVVKEIFKEVIDQNSKLNPHQFWTLNPPQKYPSGGYGKRKKRDADQCGQIHKDDWDTKDCTEENGHLCYFKKIENRMEGKKIPSISELQKMKSPCVEFFGICYYFLKDSKDYNSAMEFCNNAGGELVMAVDDMLLQKYLALTAYRNSTLNQQDFYLMAYRYVKGNEDWEEFKKHPTILELFLRHGWDDNNHEISDDQCFALQKSSTFMLEPVDCGNTNGFICKDLKFCDGSPEPKDNETNLQFDPNDSHPKGIKRTYNCIDGFYFKGTDIETSIEITCQGDNWDREDIPECIKICGDLPEAKDNETVEKFDRSEPFNNGDERVFECKEGYYFENTDTQTSLTLTCNGDKWDPSDVPGCIKICGDLPQSKDNDTVEDFDRNDPVKKGDTKTYKCKNGYYFENTDSEDSLDLTCDGQNWSPSEVPACIKSEACGDLPESKDSNTVEDFDRNDPVVKGDQRTYKCTSGYYFENTDSATSFDLTCDGEKWSPSEVPGCIKNEDF